MSTRALQDGMMLLGFRDPVTDEWLTGGSVEFYSAGTLNAKEGWEEKEKTTAITSVTLDSSGQALVYFDGVYKFIVKNSAGTTKYTLDNLKYQARNTSTVTKTADYQATADDDYILVNTDSGAVTITLAAIAGVVAPITIKNIGSSGNDVTVDGSGAETIDGSATTTLIDNASQQYVTDNTQWYGAGVATGITFTSTSLIAGSPSITFTEAAGITTINSPGSLIDVQIFETSGTWTKPSGCNSIEVWCMGGGGGGGGTNATANAAAGAGGGGALEYIQLTTGFSASEAVAVGTGGAGGASAGTTGVDSSFGSTLCVGTRGLGGGVASGTVDTGQNYYEDGYGGGGGTGIATTGSIRFNGTDGAGGDIRASVLTQGGRGGAAGGGAQNQQDLRPVRWAAVHAEGGSATGSAYGSGGHGGASGNTTSTAAGGKGGGGYVIIKSYS